ASFTSVATSSISLQQCPFQRVNLIIMDVWIDRAQRLQA
ncbi:hypothetical protein ACZ87_03959, partial [Candidatus Erwinia dacicola]